MSNPLILHIVNDLKSTGCNILIIENNDGFLFREDVQSILRNNDLITVVGGRLAHRIAYELKGQDEILLLLSRGKEIYLEDIEKNSKRIEFFLDTYIQGLHIPTVIKQSIDVLEVLHNKERIITLSKRETEQEIRHIISSKEPHKKQIEDNKILENKIQEELARKEIRWNNVALFLADMITENIGKESYQKVSEITIEVNEAFQKHRESYYHQSKVSNATKSPKNVCKVLDYIDFNFKNDKIALIVVDGMSMWQYKLLSQHLKGRKKESVIHSWIPSITQLSRQAIFRGNFPDYQYRQNPKNEGKLWAEYWLSKGISEYQIKYLYDEVDVANISSVKRLAIVYKDLDAYMHGNCKDYMDLKGLTLNWMQRSNIVDAIEELLKLEFKVFITTDHGNVEATGWRGLTSREKLGTKNKSGSQSERHLEYSEDWLFDDFIKNNPELRDSIVVENQAIYFKDNQSFSRKEKLVTHGGAHFLEVIIPFIKIENEG